MPFLDTGNGLVYYETHGAGPTVVLTHGLGGNHAIWWRQIDYFARKHRVVTFDAQGFGLSRSAPVQPAPRQADVLSLLLDELEMEETVLVGQSMGGFTCWEVAARDPGRVRALVMSASPGPLVRSDDRNVRVRSEAALTAADSLGQAERVFSRSFREARPADVLLYTQISGFGEVTQARLAGASPPKATDPPDDLPVPRVPTLFVAGGQDTLFPVDVMRDVAELAGASFLELPNSGHSPFFECPDEYNRALQGFFDANGWGAAPESNLSTPDAVATAVGL